MSRLSVLVTGAEGYVGAHLTAEFLRQGHAVSALCHASSQKKPNHLAQFHRDLRSGIEIIPGSISDAAQMRQVVQGKDLIVHLAGLNRPGLGPSRDYIDTNVAGTLNLLHAALAHNARLIHTSCSAVYGRPLYSPVDEHHPLQGQSPFASSKIAADMLVESFYRSFQLPVAIVRPFTVLGPHLPPEHVLCRFIQAALTDKASDPGDLWVRYGLEIMDFVHISDLVQAYLSLSQHDLHGQVYNIAWGQAVDFLEHISNHFMDNKFKKVFSIKKKQNTSPIHANINSAARELNYQPQFDFKQSVLESFTDLF